MRKMAMMGMCLFVIIIGVFEGEWMPRPLYAQALSTDMFYLRNQIPDPFRKPFIYQDKYFVFELKNEFREKVVIEDASKDTAGDYSFLVSVYLKDKDKRTHLQYIMKDKYRNIYKVSHVGIYDAETIDVEVIRR